MTVIKGKKVYSFPTNSENSSDVESLHLGSVSASDTESLHEGTSFRPPVIKAKLEELVQLKRAAGKRRVRRYQNRCHLQTLAEEDEEETLVIIMEPFASPFAKLLQDDDALSYWNVFIEKSEEEQAQLLDSFGKSGGSDQPPKEGRMPKISPRIRRTIKVKKNLSLEQVQKSEDDLIEFFKCTPTKVYVQHPPTYFERILLHGIAQYHGLQSLGLVENGNRRVEVFSTIADWGPAECFLTDFVAQLRK